MRRDAGLSQAELAVRLGVSRQVIAQWEAGNHEPRGVVETAQTIQREFGVPAEWMLGLLDVMPFTPPQPPLTDLLPQLGQESAAVTSEYGAGAWPQSHYGLAA